MPQDTPSLVRGLQNREETSWIAFRLVLGYVLVGFLIVATALIGLNRIEHLLVDEDRSHENTYSSLLKIQGYSNHAIQELFAYLLSGEEAELQDYRAASDRLVKESTRLPSLVSLSDGGVRTVSQLSTLAASWADVSVKAELQLESYQRTGKISLSAFHALENAIDVHSEQLDSLLKDESIAVSRSQAKKAAAIAESRQVVTWVAAVGVIALIAVGIVVTRLVKRYITEVQQLGDDLVLQDMALNSSHVGICFTEAGKEKRVLYANDAVSRLTGYSQDELKGKDLNILQGPDTSQDDIVAIRKALASQNSIQITLLNYRKSGESFWNQMYISPVTDHEGDVTHFVAAMHDVTDRIMLETQLARAQKMEAVGQLAGGVAHDFNNYLTVIQGSAELLSLEHQSNEVSEHVSQILLAASLSSDLTKQLLAFSRRQVLMPQTLDLNRVILDLDPLLRQTLGESIRLETVTAGGLGLVSADQSQIEQVLLNLVVNARDAMVDGGKITIETGNIFLDSEYVSRVGHPTEGRHVMIAVSDTGTGIEEELRDHIFEPFFSTKQSGNSGLGLATVHGIVEQSGGTIQVYSEVGAGTTFKIYLPRVHATTVTSQPEEIPSTTPMEGTVLVVEDEEMVRRITVQMIRGLGFTVLEAQDGEQGLALIQEHGTDIDILLTDVMLPNLGGRELSDQAQRLFPNLRVLYMSGYTENGIMHHGRLDEGINLLQKPFTREELKRKLAVVINA